MTLWSLETLLSSPYCVGDCLNFDPIIEDSISSFPSSLVCPATVHPHNPNPLEITIHTVGSSVWPNVCVLLNQIQRDGLVKQNQARWNIQTLPIMGNWSWELPTILLCISDCSTEEGCLVHEFLRDAANINARATKAPLCACMEKYNTYQLDVLE